MYTMAWKLTVIIGVIATDHNDYNNCLIPIIFETIRFSQLVITPWNSTFTILTIPVSFSRSPAYCVTIVCIWESSAINLFENIHLMFRKNLLFKDNLPHWGWNLYLALTRWNSLVEETFDIFSLIRQEDEKFSHQSDWTWHWQGPSDWMFNYWQWLMSHHRPNPPNWWRWRWRRRHPRVDSTSDETPADLWADMGGTSE